MSYFDYITKVEAEVIGTVNSISSILTHKGEVLQLALTCHSDQLENGFIQNFNYSTKWSRHNLKVGDKLMFRAIIKTTRLTVHKDERWVDDWGELPIELTDIENFIEIQRPKQIFKVL